MPALQRCCGCVGPSAARQYAQENAIASGSRHANAPTKRTTRYAWQQSIPRIRSLHVSAARRNVVQDPTLPDAIRKVMRASAQPVAVITALIDPPDDHSASRRGTDDYSKVQAFAHGATVSSFTSVSLEPPLIAFSLRTPSRMADTLVKGAEDAKSLLLNDASPDDSAREGRVKINDTTPHFVINILSKGQQAAAEGFARPGLALFALPVPWDGRPLQQRGRTETEHPLGQVDFHASIDAEGKSGKARRLPVPVLTDSIGSFTCSLVGQIDLAHFPKSTDGASLSGSQSGETTPTRLFLARIHGLDLFAETTGKEIKDREPLLYWNGRFTKPE